MDRNYSESRPFVVHVENSNKLPSVFNVQQHQYEAALKRHPDIARLVRTTIGCDEDIFGEAMRNADALIGYRFPRDNFRQRAPRLKWIQITGAGIDYFLPLDWVPKDLQLTNNSGAHLPKAALSGFMAVLMVNAQLPAAVTNQRERKWVRLFTATLAKKTLLVVGAGHIGAAIAERVKQEGMYVIGTRHSGKPHPAVDEMHRPDALHELLPRADIVLVNAPLTPDTRFLMGSREFAAMKKGAGFINMSRGGLVDPAALEQALRSRHLSSAMIDVTFPEPLPEESFLWTAPNLIITPHILSDDIDEYIPRTLDVFFENVRRHLAGAELTNIVGGARDY